MIMDGQHDNRKGLPSTRLSELSEKRIFFFFGIFTGSNFIYFKGLQCI